MCCLVASPKSHMVYGKGCRGNYRRLVRLVLETPIFPKVDSKRSVIHIDNLSEFVKQLMENKSGGLFLPQNAEYVNPNERVKLISEAHGKKVVMTKLFNSN